MHGYQLDAGDRRTQRRALDPSPGAIYPALNQLEDEGLVTVTAESGRRVAALTEAGYGQVQVRSRHHGRPVRRIRPHPPWSRPARAAPAAARRHPTGGTHLAATPDRRRGDNPRRRPPIDVPAARQRPPEPPQDETPRAGSRSPGRSPARCARLRPWPTSSAPIDQGTTSTRFMIFDHGGSEVGQPPARARADPAAAPAGSSTTRSRSGSARSTVIETAPERRRPGGRPTWPRIGITNQRETTVVWDRRTGRPLLQRDRLAGHPHRPDRRRARPGRPRRRHPAQGRPAAGHLLLRRQDPVDPGERRRRCARPPSAGDALFGTTDTLAAVEPDRRRSTAASTSPTSPTPAAPC